MNNDKKARLLTLLMFTFDEMNKSVGDHKSELEHTLGKLDGVLNSIGGMLRVDHENVLYGLLNTFCGVDSFHENPSDEMLTSENYKMIDLLIKTCIDLATDLKNELEKVEK